MITIADLMKLAPLTNGKVLGGKAGIHRKVEFVSVIEVNLLEIPESRSFANGKAINISSMYSVKDNQIDQVNLIKLLNSRGNSGIILCHLGIVVMELAREVIEICDQLEFPLIVMPPNVGYREIIESISDALRGHEKLKLNRSIALYDSITTLLSKDPTNSEIIDNLSKTINCKAVYFDRNLNEFNNFEFSDDYLFYIKNLVRKNTLAFMDTHENKVFPSCFPNEQIMLVPLYNDLIYFGMIAIVLTRELDDIDHMAILQTKNAIAISNLRRTDIFTQRTRLLNEYIDDLVHGYSDNEKVISNRAAALNHNISCVKAVMVVDIFDFNRVTDGKDEAEIQQIKSKFVSKAEKVLQRKSSESIGCNISDKFVILYTAQSQSSLNVRMQDLGKHIQDTLSKELGLQTSVAVGVPIMRINQISESYDTALRTIRVSNVINKKPKISVYYEYPVYLALQKSLQFQSAVYKDIENELLKHLSDYDKKNDTDYLETFRYLILSDADTLLVAKKLFLHKNTIHQRRRKIVDIMGYDPFTIEKKPQFLMILLLNELLNYNRYTISDINRY